MRKFIAIILCKILRIIGKAVGKGSSLPGKFALKVCPDVLSRVKLPEKIIAVTGSNGKTSTTEMIAHILKENGLNVVYNAEGSNQIEGVATFILSNATLGGKVKGDVLLIESDERYAKYTFKHFSPTYYVITNLYRDQLTRNGHPMWVYNAVKESVKEETTLILNADDPLVSMLGKDRENTLYFGADRLSCDTNEFVGAYNDRVYCPVCNGPMEYSTYHFNHIGHFDCAVCGHSRKDTDFTLTDADLENGFIVLDGKYKIDLALKSLYNIYNLLAAYSVASVLNISGENIAKAISNYTLKNGRVLTFTLGQRKGTFLVAKHENSISYDLSLKVAASSPDDCDVMIIVDAVSRKYFTSDVSWLYDINFDILNCDRVRNIILAGTYANDLAVRFGYTNIGDYKIKVTESIAEAVSLLDNQSKAGIYVITCFSDKAKFLERVKVD
ncbi:MAG: DUF1727 domain-containing protein [Ruminococcaceae bacterium]|nr:DUF1727 domain-containing protein [Oscillospiraceae bacterium]